MCDAAQLDTLKSELNVIRQELEGLDLEEQAATREASRTLTPQQVRTGIFKILLLLIIPTPTVSVGMGMSFESACLSVKVKVNVDLYSASS